MPMLSTGKALLSMEYFIGRETNSMSLKSNLLEACFIQKHIASVWESTEDFEAPTERNVEEVGEPFLESQPCEETWTEGTKHIVWTRSPCMLVGGHRSWWGREKRWKERGQQKERDMRDMEGDRKEKERNRREEEEDDRRGRG